MTKVVNVFAYLAFNSKNFVKTQDIFNQLFKKELRRSKYFLNVGKIEPTVVLT